MDHQKAKRKQQHRRRLHVRSNIVGTPERPRLTVFRSNKHIHAQLIDDLAGVTLVSASSVQKAVLGDAPNGGNIKVAQVVGKALADAAAAKGIKLAAFDRGHYKFHGRIKALAEAANAAGLKCCESRKPKKVEEAPAEEGEAKGAKAKGDKAAKGEKAPKAEKGGDKGPKK